MDRSPRRSGELLTSYLYRNLLLDEFYKSDVRGLASLEKDLQISGIADFTLSLGFDMPEHLLCIGRGISEDDLERLFERLFMVDNEQSYEGLIDSHKKSLFENILLTRKDRPKNKGLQVHLYPFDKDSKASYANSDTNFDSPILRDYTENFAIGEAGDFPRTEFSYEDAVPIIRNIVEFFDKHYFNTGKLWGSIPIRAMPKFELEKFLEGYKQIN